MLLWMVQFVDHWHRSWMDIKPTQSKRITKLAKWSDRYSEGIVEFHCGYIAMRNHRTIWGILHVTQSALLHIRTTNNSKKPVPNKRIPTMKLCSSTQIRSTPKCIIPIPFNGQVLDDRMLGFPLQMHPVHKNAAANKLRFLNDIFSRRNAKVRLVYYHHQSKNSHSLTTRQI